MNDYTAWPERNFSVTSLLLDPKNPRIPDLGREPTQREIVAELVEHDNVYGLAKDIADQGYFPIEILIGVEEAGKHVIVEGNRRLTAVKLLVSPELAPDDKIKKFRLLQGRVVPETIKKVRVVIAPSREAAAPLIINRHTQMGVKGWKPAQQARYMRTLLVPGMSVDELAEHLGVSRGQLTDNLRTDTMYQIARSLKLSDEARAVVEDPRAFNASALERLVQSTKAMQFLGVKFDDSGGLSGSIHADEFKKGYTRMVTDIAVGNVDTRSLHGNKEIEQYLGKFGTAAPNRRRKGAFTSASLLGTGPAPTTPIASPKNGGPATPRDSAYLIPSNLKCRLTNPRINDVFRELRRLKLAEYPNGVAVLLRIFVELIIGNYLDKTGKIDPLLQQAKQKGKASDWYPSLRQMLTALMADTDIKLVPLVRKGLNKMISVDDHPLSLDQMDQFVHNRYVGPTEKELRKMWAILEDLVQQLLLEPAPPAKPTKP